MPRLISLKLGLALVYASLVLEDHEHEAKFMNELEQCKNIRALHLKNLFIELTQNLRLFPMLYSDNDGYNRYKAHPC